MYTRREEICLSITGRMVTSSCALTLEPQNVSICGDGTLKEVASRMLLGVTVLLSSFSRTAVPGSLAHLVLVLGHLSSAVNGSHLMK